MKFVFVFYWFDSHDSVETVNGNTAAIKVGSKKCSDTLPVESEEDSSSVVILSHVNLQRVDLVADYKVPILEFFSWYSLDQGRHVVQHFVDRVEDFWIVFVEFSS